MKIRSAVIFLSLYFLPFIVMAQQPDTAASNAFFRKAMREINPKHVSWVKNSAQTVNEKGLTESEAKKMASQYAVLAGINGQDIEAMAFLVLMQAAKSAQEDLKAIMDKVKSINEKKKKLREVQARLNAKNAAISRIQLDSFSLLLTKRPARASNTETKPVTRAEMDELSGQMKAENDSLSEMGEEQQLKMQMVMDRMKKADSAASNMLKKFSQAASSIIQNLK